MTTELGAAESRWARHFIQHPAVAQSELVLPPAELGIELSLAGHTHGGQIQVEILDRRLNPARFMTNFVAGLYELPMGNGNGSGRKSAFLYVNRGLGTFGIPVRLGVPPEITLLTLRTAG